MRPLDLQGQKFGKLKVLSRGASGPNGHSCWWCGCECGQLKSIRGMSLVGGDKSRSCGCDRIKCGKERYNWKGGRQRTQGYIRIKRPEHPNAGSRGMLFEHVYVMSQHIGRPLVKGETVHHKNGQRDDNRIENLELRAGAHGPGQSVGDLIAWAKELLRRYEPEALR